MALKSWLASLKADVSNVLGVQAHIHAGLSRYVTDTADVSGVSGSGGMLGADTADTADKNQTYQRKPSIHAGCTADMSDTCKKINTEALAANELLTGGNLTAPPEPKRLFRLRASRLNPTEQQAAQAYYAHHFQCRSCQAGGQGRGRRCAVGLALWNDYTGAGDTQTEGGQHGQA